MQGAQALQLLRRRTDECVAREDSQLAMSVDALVEASFVLDTAVRVEPISDDQYDVGGLNAVALLHTIRALGLAGHPDESYEAQAYLALYVLVLAVDPAAVPPQVHEGVSAAITAGAATDLPTVALNAMKGHSVAVYTAYRRSLDHPHWDMRIVDVLLRSRQRLLGVAGPKVPGYPARLLDVAAAHSIRSATRDNNSDLDRAIELVDEVLARDVGKHERAITRRAHLLRGPALQRRAQRRQRSGDLDAAIESFRAAVELTDRDDPALPTYQARLVEAEQARSDGVPRRRRFGWRRGRSAD